MSKQNRGEDNSKNENEKANGRTTVNEMRKLVRTDEMKETTNQTNMCAWENPSHHLLIVSLRGKYREGRG